MLSTNKPSSWTRATQQIAHIVRLLKLSDDITDKLGLTRSTLYVTRVLKIVIFFSPASVKVMVVYFYPCCVGPNAISPGKFCQSMKGNGIITIYVIMPLGIQFL